MYQCPDCGGTLYGDGYTRVISCEYVVLDLDFFEPDADPVYCGYDKDADV